MTTSAQHRCINGVSTRCTRGNGKPSRKRCAACGSALLTTFGTWGCFVWTSANRYPLSEALSVHATEAAARHAAEKDDHLVWRFVVSA
jgi:hypothetical protein